MPELALGAALFVLFLPQHGYINAMVSDGNLAELFACAAVYLLVQLQQLGVTWRRVWAVGVCVALAVLSKATGYFLIPLGILIGLSLAWRWYRPGATRRRRSLAVLAAVVTGLLALAVLPLAVLPLVSAQPLAMAANIAANLDNLRHLGAYLLRLNAAGEFEQSLRSVFASFWGDFGWMRAGLPQAVYWALFIPLFLAAVGWVRHWRAQRRAAATTPGATRGASPYPLLGLAAALPAAFMLGWFVLSPVGLQSNQARYLFGGLSALAVLLVRGWLHLAPASAARRVLWVIAVGLVLLDALALFGTLLAYFFPEAWPSMPALLAALTAHKPGLPGWAGWYVGLVAVYAALLARLAADLRR